MSVFTKALRGLAILTPTQPAYYKSARSPPRILYLILAGSPPRTTVI